MPVESENSFCANRYSSITDRVRGLVKEQLAGRDLSVDGIADRLHMSRRTLHRRLTEEGVTFKELADEVRLDLSLRYLERPELGMGEISFSLGFSNLASFCRAFKRWTGRTPMEYRRTRGE